MAVKKAATMTRWDICTCCMLRIEMSAKRVMELMDREEFPVDFVAEYDESAPCETLKLVITEQGNGSGSSD